MVDLLTDAQFDMFRKTIYDESGITFSESNRTILDSRLKERLREKSLSNVEDYYKLILSDKEEMKMFLDSVTTNLTRFFRNQPHFDALSHYVIPKIVEVKKFRPKNGKNMERRLFDGRRTLHDCNDFKNRFAADNGF